MTGSPRLSRELTPAQVRSAGTPMPDFIALESLPKFLGHEAHTRLEEILGIPVASDDAEANVYNEATGKTSGVAFGDLIGREREFTRNLPQIQTNVKEIASHRGVPEDQLWDEITEVLVGSGIGSAMHRTLEGPVGGSYGARSFMDQRANNGIALLVRENIANWGARRHDRLTSLVAGMSQKALASVELVIYAGSGRQYRGAELWRPEVQPYVTLNDEDQKVTDLTESSAARRIHEPRTAKFLQDIGLESVDLHVVEVESPKATGDEVMNAVAAQHGDQLKNLLLVESGNAPAGYTQLAGALVLARETHIDPSEQYLAVTDSVEIAQPNRFAALDLEAKSKLQNAATALNSINGWMSAISRVNEYYAARRS